MTTMFCTSCGRQSATGGGLRFCTECGAPLIAGSYGRFEVRRLIGHGPTGVVVLAYDPMLDRAVALRLLAAAIVDEPVEYQRLTHSAQVMAAHDHPNWVQVFNLESVDDSPAVVMEYVDGSSLGAVMDGGRLAPRECTAALAGAFAGVQYLHELGLAHGDLTPNNVLLDRLGTSKITDVAAPLALASGSAALGYAAPEQLSGAQPSVSADIYTLGTLVYGSVTGRSPFPTTSISDSLAARQQPLNLDGFPAALAPLVGACVQSDPAKRPADVVQLARRLQQSAEAEFGSDWRTAGAAGLAALVAGAVGASVVAGGAGAGVAAVGVGEVVGGSQAATGGLMATIAAKPVLAGAVVAGVVAVAGLGGYAFYKTQNADGVPTAAAAADATPLPSPTPTAAGWIPVASMLNAAAPPGLPEQCFNGKTPPTINLSNGKGKIPTTRGYGTYSMIGTPLKGRFVDGGPEYTTFAFQCIGDGVYQMTEIVVLDAAGSRVRTSPATTSLASAPVVQQFVPSGSVSQTTGMTFTAVGATPVLNGKWSARGGGSSETFKMKITLTQMSATSPIKQVVTPLTTVPTAPGIPEGLSYFRPDDESNPTTVTIQRSGDSVTMEFGSSGGIGCFRGTVTNTAFAGQTKEYGEADSPMSTSNKPIPFSTSGRMLTIRGTDYHSEEPEGVVFDPRCKF